MDTHEYTVRETEAEGDAITLAKKAADVGAQLITACGGDGTIYQIVSGLEQADALANVAFVVIPGGTGNNFAQNISVASILYAFELLETE